MKRFILFTVAIVLIGAVSNSFSPTPSLASTGTSLISSIKETCSRKDSDYRKLMDELEKIYEKTCFDIQLAIDHVAIISRDQIISRHQNAIFAAALHLPMYTASTALRESIESGVEISPELINQARELGKKMIYSRRLLAKLYDASSSSGRNIRRFAHQQLDSWPSEYEPLCVTPAEIVEGNNSFRRIMDNLLALWDTKPHWYPACEYEAVMRSDGTYAISKK